MTTKFIVLATQRTGSTWVVDMLDSHPRVVAYSELFLMSGKGVPQWGGGKDQVFWSTFRDASPLSADADPRRVLTAYLDEVFRPRDGIDAVGFKLMYDQAAAIPALPDALRARGVVVVHLVRRNSLDVILSTELARLSGRWHDRSDGPREPRESSRISLPVEGLVERIRSLEAAVSRAGADPAWSMGGYRDFFYEDLRDDRGRFGEMLEFLGVHGGAAGLTSALRVVNERSHRRTIANYEEVRERLAAFGLGHLVRE